MVSLRQWTLALVALALTGCGQEAREPEPSATPSQAARADLALTRRLTTDMPGCSAAIGVDGQVVWTGTRGVANLETKAPLTADTVFDIGSVSKQFTATAVLLLAGSGALALKDPVSDHVDGLPAWARQVSVDELIHHTSGIPDYVALLEAQGHALTERTTQDQAVRAIAGTKALRFRPGSRFEYSNSNYLLLAEVVRHASGESLPQFLRERVFAPLRLAMTMDPVTPIPGKATSYSGGQVADSRWEQVGDGGVQATPSELVRWADNYRTGELGGAPLLAAQLADPVPSDLGQGMDYAAGIIVGDDGTLLHAGHWAGFRTAFEIRPDRHTAYAVSCNSADLDPLAVVADLRSVWP
ncbi:beta-lactamase family protein [Micromonospora sp. CPCC 205371]|nr:beta-lactamase family protein [Micromonospora sp. CPCC 205371]